jgi:TonB family protein
MHGVQIGSRTELPGFLQKLLEDRHLAMDFWAFIGKVSNREGGQLSDDQMLGVVVEGITASELSLEDTGLEPTVDDLRAMLAGVDIHGPEQSPVVMAPFPRPEPSSTEQTAFPQIDAESQHNDGRVWTHAAESARATESAVSAESFTSPTNSQATPARKKADGDSDRPVVLPAAAVPLHLDEARLRLELTRLVQEYFENIDKRIAKLEPHPEGTVATAVTPRSLDEPDSEVEEEELRLRRMGRSRLVLEPAELPGEILLAAKDVKRPITIPLEHYSPPPRFGRAPLILVLVLIGAGFEIYRDPSLLRHMFAAVVHHFRNDPPQDRATDAPPPSRSYDQAPASPESSPPSAVQSPATSIPTPPIPATSNQSPSAASQTAEDRSDSSSHTAARALAQSGQAIADGLSSIEGAISVNPSVMDRNLIVSRVPAYPESAKLNRVQGNVVMQALISKEGTVKRVYVTEGDSRLRSAAEDAVYKWRYRPYVVNGQPVEVATTVTVNFNLNR